MTRILVLSTWPALYPMAGGGGTPIEGDMFAAFLAAGHEVDLVLPPSEGPDDFPPGVHLHRVPGRRLPALPGPLDRPPAWASIGLRLARRGLAVARAGPAPGVVYGLGGFAIPAAAWVGRRLRVPSVGVVYGTFLAPSMHSRLRLAEAFEETLAFKSPVTVLSVLDDGTRGDEVAAALGVPAERLRFWMHGVDRAAVAAATPDRLGLPPGRPLAVSASRLASWKRVDRILHAWPGVLREVPEALLALSGSGPAEEGLHALVRELRIEDSVRFLGPLERGANLRLIAAADCFCSFYDYSNVGVALLEALSCGVACVVADTGATSELVEDGRSGLVVGPEDTRGASRAIAAVLGDPGLRGRLGDGAAELAERALLSIEDRMSLELELVKELGRRTA